MRMQSKQEAARTPLVRMRAALRLQYYIMNVPKAKTLAGKKRASELKEIMRTPRQVLKQQQ